MNYRKTLLATVLVVPLTLTACGSDEENADNAATSATSQESSTSAKPGEDNKDAKEGKESKDGKESESSKSSSEDRPDAPEREGANRPAGAAPAPSNAESREGSGNGRPAPAGGGGGNDTEAITRLVEGLDDGGNNMQALAYYTLDNSCTAYINSRGGEAQLRSQADGMVDPATGQPLKFSDFEKMAREAGVQVPNSMGMAKIQKVENVNVTGDRATAFVTSEQNATEMQFAREGGQWKICPAG